MSSSIDGVLKVVVGLGVVVVVVLVVLLSVVVGITFRFPLEIALLSRSGLFVAWISFKLFSTARAMMRLASAVSESSMFLVLRTFF